MQERPTSITRLPSTQNVRLGLLGLRSFFRATMVFALLLGGCEAFKGAYDTLSATRDDDVPAASERQANDDDGMSGSLTRQLEDLLVVNLSSCADPTADRCTAALVKAASATGATRPMPKGFVRARTGRGCRRGNFAQFEFDATYRVDGKTSETSAVAWFVRSRGKQWGLLGVQSADQGEPLCDKPPYHDVEEAKSNLAQLKIDWVVSKGTHQLGFSGFWFYNCAIGKVEIDLDAGGSPVLVDPGCWVKDGFFFDKEDSLFTLPSPAPKQVSLRVTFTDGSTSSWTTLTNPEPTSLPSTPSKEPTPKSSRSGFPNNRALIMPNVGGAQVILDGEYQCDAPCEIRVPVGDGVVHQIRLSKDGYIDQVTSWEPKSVAEKMPTLPRMVKR